MPRWDIVLEENDIWSVVNYLRSLGEEVVKSGVKGWVDREAGAV